MAEGEEDDCAPCWYAVKGNAGWKGGRKQSTVWAIEFASGSDDDDADAATVHATQKPVACMQRPIQNHTDPGDAV